MLRRISVAVVVCLLSVILVACAAGGPALPQPSVNQANQFAQQPTPTTDSPNPTLVPLPDKTALGSKFPGYLEASKYFPSTSIFYGAFRTDGDYLTSLDALVTKIKSALPPDMVGSLNQISVQFLLDTFSRSLYGDTFEVSIRPWLGNYIAFGVGSADWVSFFAYRYGLPPTPPLMAVISITNKDGAITAVDQFLSRLNLRPTSRNQTAAGMDYALNLGGGTILRVVVTDTAILVGTKTAVDAAFNAAVTKLDESRFFLTGFNSLPASRYDLAFYVDWAPVLNLSSTGYYYNYTQNFLLTRLLVRAAGPLVIGGTFADNRALLLDVVQSANDVSGLKEAGLRFGGGRNFDPAFENRIPDTTFAMLHGADLDATYHIVRDNLNNLANLFTMVPTSANADLISGPERLTAFFANLLTGLDYRNDLAPWIKGDYMIFLADNPNYTRNNNSNLPIQLGVAFGVTKPGNRTLIPKLVREWPSLLSNALFTYFTMSQEKIGDADALVARIPMGRNAQGVVMGEAFVLAMNDSVLALGSRQMVTAILAGNQGNPGVLDTQPYLLKNAGMAGYWMPALTSDMLGRLEQTSPYDWQRQQIRLLRTLAGLFTSGSITGTVDAQGNVGARFALSLKN